MMRGATNLCEGFAPDALWTASGHELDDLFRRSPAGAYPRGESEGFFLLAPGTPASRPLTALLRLGWRGKDFDVENARVVNRILPIGLRAVRARVRVEKSRLDGQSCYVLDYAPTSIVARNVRDEIREIAPGLYLGLVYWRGLRLGRFALQFRTAPVGSRGDEGRAFR